MALNNVAKRRRYIDKYKDERFELVFFVGSVKDYGGLSLMFTDKVNPEFNISASFSDQRINDWIQATKWYRDFLTYILKENNE